MENHGVQRAKTIPAEKCIFHFIVTTIRGLDHDLMQLLKTSERKMVMYNIASNKNGIFRRIGKATG